MALFVINRHEEAIQDDTIDENEEDKIQQVLNKIEKKKQLRAKQKIRKKEKVEKKLEAIKKTISNRRKKRIEKQLQNDMIDAQNTSTLCESVEAIEKTSNEYLTKEENSGNKRVKKSNEPSEMSGFTVLGSTEFQKKEKVKRVLPKWLSEPSIISTNLQNLQTKVSEIKALDKILRKSLKSNGVEYFFPVQAVVIPWLIEETKNSSILFPRDICVSAPTGSGKTLAFVLPILHCLKSHKVKKIRALVILPTKELAQQVYGSFKLYSEKTFVKIGLMAGQDTFESEQKLLVEYSNVFGYFSKIDVLVCTAGRLVDHLKNTKGFSLHDLEFLVIDEADRVLENIQNDWLYHLGTHIHTDSRSYQTTKILNLQILRSKRPPQKLLFSATLSQDPEKLQKLSLFQPKLFTSVVEKEDIEINSKEQQENSTFIGKYTTPKELTEKYIVCSIDLKPLVLYKFIKDENLTKTLIFTNSTDSAHRLTILLKSLFQGEKKVEELPKTLPTNKQGLLKTFVNGDVNILVVTDRLTRGIDLLGVQCVISYGAPKYLKTYIHRVGRTARAGQTGLAVTLLQQNQLTKFLNNLKTAGKTNLNEVVIEEEVIENLTDKYKEALANLKNSVLKEEQIEVLKMKHVKRPRKIS